MKAVLVVEDEKLIRQGICTMIRRSGVPVEVILECGNGEMALEVLREQRIDVMFTDIRMPKMDGIELVKRMQELPHVPLTVAVSGYDDFSYAVEMLRSGVREYILKPVEREKITEILQKFDRELEQGRKTDAHQKRLGEQQMKQLMLLEHTDEELETIRSGYKLSFFEEEYAVCCRNRRADDLRSEGGCNFLPDVGGNDLYVAQRDALPFLLRNELAESYVGVSGWHRGLDELRAAYLESLVMRRTAFLRCRPVAGFGEETEHVPQTLVDEALKLTEEPARLRRVQLIGTERREELARAWRQFLSEVKNGRIAPELYVSCMEEFFRDVARTYRNALEEDDAVFASLRELFGEDHIGVYEEKLLAWLTELSERVGNALDINRNRQKLAEAVKYIEENYAKDLNMAVVSNYIEMNYSLFSYSFKQYTGSNFVNYLKDIRMREAKRLLAESDLRIIEISQAVGYDNEKHFMKMFKASCGVSPSEYRKNMRQEP